MANSDFPVVGIGASAGGLEAIQELIKSIPADTGMAYVIIQHLPPDYRSVMAELMQSHTELPIRTMERKTILLPNYIYLLPPGKNAYLKDYTLNLQDRSEDFHINMPIDLFFNSLGIDAKEKSVGIILSGSGSDGSRGIQSIKHHRGMVVVQDPAHAKFSSMPQSVINTTLVDYILKPEHMVQQVVEYFRGDIKPEGENIPIEDNTEQNLKKILRLVKHYSGVDFTAYKRQTTVRRLEKLMKSVHISSLSEYYNYLSDQPEEVKKISQELLIGVTDFFRDPDAFKALENKVFPVLFRNDNVYQKIRIWCAGCSNGKEAYTLAMMMDHYLKTSNLSHNFKVFASDIDREAIETASRGMYRESELENVPENYKHDYFEVRPNNMCYIDRNLREKIVFTQHNILKDPPFIRIDLVVCRNMLIYFQPYYQFKVIRNFQFALNKDSHVFLGASESIDETTHGFKSIDSKWKLYQYVSQQSVQVQNPVVEVPDREKLDRSYRSSSKSTAGVAQDLFADVLLNRYAPDSIFINQQQEIVYVAGNAYDYLKMPQKQVSFKLADMTSAELLLIIRSALSRLNDQSEEVLYREIAVQKKDSVQSVNLTISRHLLKNESQEERYYLIEFVPVEGDEDIRRDITINYSTEQAAAEQVKKLEEELSLTRQELQATVEELESSNEELQASNEELHASNEELQSTNEELQSVNEELQTVNTELQYKIRQLAEANSDMDNLFNATDIASLFLDNYLCIRKFTSPATRHFNLQTGDIGRSITDITGQGDMNVLEKQLKEALLEGNSRESEVKDSTGTYYLRSVQPYYNSSNKIDGAIVTFLNIHSLKITEKDLIESERLLRSIVDGISAFLIRLSADFRYLFVNKPVADTLNLSVDEIIGKYPENLKVDIEAINRVKHLWQRAIDEKQELSYENTMETNRGTLHVITKVIPEITDEGKVDSILLITTDITELKEAHHNLNQQEQEDVKISGQANLEAIIEASDDYIWSVDTNYQLMVINPAYRQFLSNHFKADPELGSSMLLNQFPEKTVQFWQSNYDKCLAGERIVRVTDEPNGKGTEKRQHKLFPIVSEQGEIVGVSCISHRLP